MKHIVEAQKLVGRRLVDMYRAPGDVTMEQVYQFAEAIHPLRASHPAMLRVIEPEQACTDDYYENRLNLQLDENNVIVSADWG